MPSKIFVWADRAMLIGIPSVMLLLFLYLLVRGGAPLVGMVILLASSLLWLAIGIKRCFFQDRP